MNVRINAGDLEDKDFVERTLAEGRRIEAQAIERERHILEIVDRKMAAS